MEYLLPHKSKEQSNKIDKSKLFSAKQQEEKRESKQKKSCFQVLSPHFSRDWTPKYTSWSGFARVQENPVFLVQVLARTSFVGAVDPFEITRCCWTYRWLVSTQSLITLPYQWIVSM